MRVEDFEFGEKVSYIQRYSEKENNDPDAIKSAKKAIALDKNTIQGQVKVGVCLEDCFEMKYVYPENLKKGWNWKKGDRAERDSND